jgi:hypothetical protein
MTGDYSTLYRLFIDPAWVMVVTGDDGARWITDRKVLFRDYIANAVFRDLPDGLYELRATKPPKPVNTGLDKLSDLDAMHRRLAGHAYSPIRPPDVPLLYASPEKHPSLIVTTEDNRLGTFDWAAWQAWHQYALSLHGFAVAYLSSDDRFMRFDLHMSTVTEGWAFACAVKPVGVADLLGHLAWTGGYHHPHDCKHAAALTESAK